MAAALGAQDHLYTLIERHPADPVVRVVGSIIDYQLADADLARAVEFQAAPDVASLAGGHEAGYVEGSATFDVLARALAARHARGLGPVTLMSCGQPAGQRRCRAGVHTGRGRVTRRPAARVGRRAMHVPELDGRPDHPGHDRRRPGVAAVHPRRGRPLARRRRTVPPWVIEDEFAAGRQPWEDVGVVSRRRPSLGAVQRRLLNASQSAIAYLCSSTGRSTSTRRSGPRRSGGSSSACSPTRRCRRSRRSPAIHTRSSSLRCAAVRPGWRRDQLARMCIGGTDNFAVVLVPTVVDHWPSAVRSPTSDHVGRMDQVPRSGARRGAGE